MARRTKLKSELERVCVQQRVDSLLIDTVMAGTVTPLLCMCS